MSTSNDDASLTSEQEQQKQRDQLLKLEILKYAGRYHYNGTVSLVSHVELLFVMISKNVTAYEANRILVAQEIAIRAADAQAGKAQVQ